MKSNAKTEASGQLFKSSVLELLTRTNPLIILSIYVPLCALSLWYFYSYVQPSIPLLSFMFFIGLLSWTFAEYILHRFIFHWVGDHKFIQRFREILPIGQRDIPPHFR